MHTRAAHRSAAGAIARGAASLAMRTLAVLTAGVAITTSIAAPLQAQITNGGFETPVIPNGGDAFYSTGSTDITGWTVVGADGNVGLVNSAFTYDGFNFPAHGGSAWLDLTGTSDSQTGVAQSLATTGGAHMTFRSGLGTSAATRIQTLEPRARSTFSARLRP